MYGYIFYFKRKTAYEMRISDWSSDVCSSDLWFLADLAIAMAGYISVGLYPKQSCDAVKFILKHSDTKAIFVGPMPDADEFMSAVPEGTIRIGFPYEGVSHCDHQWDDLERASEPFADRKSVVEGKSESVSVDRGGRSSIKKKNEEKKK